MDKNINTIVERLINLSEMAYETYLPLVEDACNMTMSENDMSHLLDGLLSFAYDDKMLELFKMVCRRYYYLYTDCINDYVGIYRQIYTTNNLS